ncbi:signal protein, partial [Parabacteroides distasonis]
RYQVRGALINVVLTKGDGSVPLQGEAFAKAEQRHEAHMDERLSLLWNKGRLSADAMVGISHGRSFHTMDKEGVHSLADGSSHDVYTNEVIRGSSSPDYNYRLGIDYRFADNHVLSLAYTGSSTGYSQNNTMTGMQTSSVK